MLRSTMKVVPLPEQHYPECCVRLPVAVVLDFFLSEAAVGKEKRKRQDLNNEILNLFIFKVFRIIEKLGRFFLPLFTGEMFETSCLLTCTTCQSKNLLPGLEKNIQ